MARKSDAVALPGARAVARHVRISPMKARRVVDLVRGLPAKEALTVLQFAPQAASEQVYKVLASAVANAENNERLDPDSLLVRRLSWMRARRSSGSGHGRRGARTASASGPVTSRSRSRACSRPVPGDAVARPGRL